MTTDLLAGLTTRERALLPLLFDACQEMDQIFWQEAAGERHTVLSAIEDPDIRSLADFNYGPWDRRQGNAPLLAGVGSKPAGACFYPPDMDIAEFEAECAESPERAAALRSPYSVVRRDGAGRLVAAAYHDAFASNVTRAASTLREAAIAADDPALRTYLELRADALLTDDYRASELAWLDVKDSRIDLIIGPVEVYEDALFGRKTAHEGILLLKDKERSAHFDHVTTLLPHYSVGCPSPTATRWRFRVSPGHRCLRRRCLCRRRLRHDAGRDHAPERGGSPARKGNAAAPVAERDARDFDLMTVAVGATVIAAGQQGHVDFEAYFAFVMCHEIAHGLGVKRTIARQMPISDALLDQHAAVEEGKADVVGLHMLASLIDSAELPETTLLSCYVTYVAELIRQIRKGSASGYARANLANLGFFAEAGAIRRDDAAATYEVDVRRMRDAIDSLAGRYLRLQGDGDYAAALTFIPKEIGLSPTLKVDLDRLAAGEHSHGRQVRASDRPLDRRDSLVTIRGCD